MRYFIHFIFATLLFAALLAGYNWRVDPYAIYHDEPDAEQQLLVMSERIFKTVGLAHRPADVLFIGTSRTDIGIAREQPSLQGKRLHSLATFGQPINETRRLLERVMQDGKPQTIVIGLDFFAFNALFDRPSDYVAENYSEMRKAALLLSVSTLSSSIAKQRQSPVALDTCCYANGFRAPRAAASNYRQQFASSERSYLMEKYLPYPQCSFAYGSEAESTLEDMRAILNLAHRNHVAVKLFISPSHARQWETLAAGGLWDQWEDWKRTLVQINEEEARRAQQPAFALWDFSGYDQVSTEELPRAGASLVMSNYSDSSHYTPMVGQRLVSNMFGVSDGWGEMISSANLDFHLAELRAARQRYRTSHMSEVAEIETMAREVSLAKHCVGTP